MRRICILDYGLGNIKSLYNAIKYIGYNPYFFSENKKQKFDLLIIPGVGSFYKASNLILKNKNIKNFIYSHAKDSKILGICLGMQILFDQGYENKKSKGLSIINGEVKKLKNEKKIILPFVGFQKVQFKKKSIFYNDFNEKKFYFVHSYHAIPNSNSHILAETINQDIKYCCAIKSKNIIGTQFHPEKSGEIGLEFIRKIINL